MPKEYRIKGGSRSLEDVEMFRLEQMPTFDYARRTKMNVTHSDGTVRIAYDFDSRGERLTKSLCEKHGKPCFDVPLIYYDGWYVDDKNLLGWLRREQISVLNVAGNSDPLIEPTVERFLIEIFEAA